MLQLTVFLLVLTLAVHADYDPVKSKFRKSLFRKQISDGEIRLADGPSESTGRVEIFHDGAWGTVCDDDWDDNDAMVVCRQLGYPLGETADIWDNFGQGSGKIWLDNVLCEGQELRLTSCAANNFGDHNCNHIEDAGVACRTGLEGVTEGDIRLSGGQSYGGRVEIFHSGEWGTVCDDFWDDADAQVVCRQLGLSGGNAYPEALFGEGTGLIWLDDVECDGSESTLSSCEARMFGSENCSHDEDASVICTNPGEQYDQDGV